MKLLLVDDTNAIIDVWTERLDLNLFRTLATLLPGQSHAAKCLRRELKRWAWMGHGGPSYGVRKCG